MDRWQGREVWAMHFRRREYKMLLLPERLTDLDQCLECSRVVEKVCHHLKLHWEAPLGLATGVRWISFFDTPQGDLNQAKFALRQRTWVRDGWPEKVHEVTLKYRQEDAQSVRAQCMDCALPGKQRLKEQVLPCPSNGQALCYANKFIAQVHDLGLHGMPLPQAQQYFPPLSRFHPEQSLQRVGEDTIEELVLYLGTVKFAHQLRAAMSLCLWRSRHSGQALVGELSFNLKYSGWDALEAGVRRKIEQFYLQLLEHLSDWRYRDETKTHLIYRLYQHV